MMTPQIVMRCSALVLMLGCSLAGSGALAASVDALLPTPGLYQIDSDASHERAGGRVRTEKQVTGASGATRSRTVADSRVHEQQIAGAGGNSYCVKPHKAGAMTVLADLEVLQHCPKQSHQFVGKNKLVHRAQCPSGEVTVTITKLDNQTWDIETRQQAARVGGAVDMSFVRAALEHQKLHGATKAERAQAAAQLLELPAAQKEMDLQREQQRAVFQAALDKAESPEERAMYKRGLAAMSPQGLAAGPGDNTVTVRERWRRVANQCTGQPKP